METRCMVDSMEPQPFTGLFTFTNMTPSRWFLFLVILLLCTTPVVICIRLTTLLADTPWARLSPLAV